MLPDRVSNPGPLTYESGALPIALRGPAHVIVSHYNHFYGTVLILLKNYIQRYSRIIRIHGALPVALRGPAPYLKHRELKVTLVIE